MSDNLAIHTESLRIAALESSGDQQKSDVFAYFIMLIKGVEAGEWREEYAANQMVEILVRKNLAGDSDLDLIFDCAAETEVPRETSYKQSMELGNWSEETANRLKDNEWRLLVREVTNRSKMRSGVLHKAVLDIDEVEYMITEEAEQAIARNESEIVLVRLFDKERRAISLTIIKEAIQQGGIVDYLQ